MPQRRPDEAVASANVAHLDIHQHRARQVLFTEFSVRWAGRSEGEAVCGGCGGGGEFVATGRDLTPWV